MFGFFKRKPTLMDQTIKAMYGENPPQKSADVDAAVGLVVTKLLPDALDAAGIAQITILAKQLNAGPIPYSTYDLAVSVALNVFKNAKKEDRKQLFNTQLAARLTALEWGKEGKLAPILLSVFEDTLYKLYMPDSADNGDSISAEMLGKKLSELLDPAEMLKVVRQWHPSSEARTFVTVAAVRITGFNVGSNQRSIMDRIDREALLAVHTSLITELVAKELVDTEEASNRQGYLSEVVKLSKKFTGAFYANASSKPPQPIPHWFVGKAACLYLQADQGVPNPEELMQLAQFLSDSMIATKKLLDELLDAGVHVTAPACNPSGSG